MFIEIVSVLYIILFMYTAASKILDFERFGAELGKSPLLAPFPVFAAVFIPFAEIMVAIALTQKKYKLLALHAALGLMTIFTAYLIVILNFSFYVPCTCGGVIQSMSWKGHIVFNSAFVILALLSIIFYDTGKSESRMPVVYSH